METFRGKAHLPGANEGWNIQLEIDWDIGEVNVNIDEAPAGIADWPGLVVQTFSPIDELVFRTKGIPSVFTHWWHFVRSADGNLFGIILGLPAVTGRWTTCPISLEKIE